jgi:hypothetical protein
MHVLALATILLGLHGDPARRLVFVSFAQTSSLPKVATGLRTHRRMEFIAYFAGTAGSVWDLATKPASRAAYRALITPLG